MEKKVIFCSGLPRAGSTLLMNILAQNLRFHCTATSGVLELMLLAKNNWDKIAELRAIPDEEEKDMRRLSTLRGIFLGFHADVKEPVIIDKSRGWLSEIEMVEAAFGCKVKILVPVRDMRDVLASFEKLYRKTKSFSQVPHEAAFYAQYQTVEGRCNVLCRSDQMVGVSFNRIKDAVSRGFRDRLYFVEFDRLTHRPDRVFEEIYDFLEEEPHRHDFEHIEQVTWENDQEYQWKNLHRIKPKLVPSEPQWPSILKGNISDMQLESFSRDACFWRAWL